MVQQQERSGWIAEKQVPNDKEKLDFLKPEDFFHERHRIIFKVVLDLYVHHRSIHEISVQEELERAGYLETHFQDNPFYVQDMTPESFVIDPTNDAHYLRKLAICRSIAYGVSEPTKLAFEGEAEQALEALAQLAYKFQIGDQKSEPVAVSDLSTNFVENLTRLCDRKGQIIGVGTGFIDLDRLTGGLQKSDLIIVAARPSMGKTSFAMNIAENVSIEDGKTVAVFSLEMSKEALLQRMLCSVARVEAGIDQQRPRTGWIDDEDWEKIVVAIERINNMNIYIDDSANVTPDEIRNKVRRLITSGVNIGLIMIDYLQLMSLPGKNGRSQENRVQEVSEISRKLKGVARDLDMPVLALSQLSRAVESRQSKIPQLSDLRESGSIEQDSDVVMFLYRDDVYNPESERQNIADVIVAKHRNGPIGTVSLYFHKSQTRFDNLEVTAPVEQ